MEDWSVVHKVSLLGFLGALVFGVVANKTHFCIMGSISDWVNMGSRVRFRAWMLSI
ncbi:MAG: YeeE/YedE family protein, partial [Proteobacteria bacterium]|nr:YeeE/YedE family protein [Pseudomonadota bacterium]